jgi:hypothetical protein
MVAPMGDEQLRELERRWRTTGALDDEVAWVSALVRAGEVSAGDLELAATLGSLAARRLLPAERRWPSNVQAMAASLERAPRPVQVRVLVTLARLVLPVWRQRHPADERLADAVEAAEESLTGAAADHWLSEADRHFRRSGRELLEAAIEASRLETPPTRASHAAMVCLVAASFACTEPPFGARAALVTAAWEAQCALTEHRDPTRPLAGGKEIARALRRTLVPWLREP